MINPEKKHKKFKKTSVEGFICRFVNMLIDTHTKTFLMHILDLESTKNTPVNQWKKHALKIEEVLFLKNSIISCYFKFSSSS